MLFRSRRLEWTIEWGDGSADRVIAAHRDAGQIAPEELFAPDLLPEAAPIFAAWCELTHDRPIGASGAGGIPFASIDRYAARFGPQDIDDFAFFMRAIRMMDGLYLDVVNKKEA